MVNEREIEITMDNADLHITHLERRYNNDITHDDGMWNTPDFSAHSDLERAREKRSKDMSLEERVSYLEEGLNKRIGNHYVFSINSDNHLTYSQNSDDELAAILDKRQKERNKHLHLTQRIEWLYNNWRDCGYQPRQIRD